MQVFKSGASAISLAVAAIVSSTALAAPPVTSPYATDPQSSHVEDATSSGIGEVNMIACIMAAMRPDALVNKGDYIALVDKNKCDAAKRSSSSNAGASGDGAQAASYITAIVNSSRASNTQPMVTKAWLGIEEEGKKQTIFVHIAATQAPTASNAYGVFRLDYCGTYEGITGCPSRGYLEGTTTGLNFYQLDDDGQHSETTAMKLVSAAGANGSGRLQHDGDNDSSAFAFAYDATLFRRSDDNGDQCFSRDAADPDTGLSVWRYGLYDALTGARVTLSSGFPIEFTAAGTKYNGYLGYYGLQLPFEAQQALTNGSTVDKVDYTNGNTAVRTSYTVLKSAGKLTKYTRKTRTLQAMDQIKFQTFIGNDANNFFAGATPNVQYELYWDEPSKTFLATGRMECNNNGCQLSELDTPKTIALSYWASLGGVQGYSQSLGGEIFISLQGVSDPVVSADVQVVYRTQDLVYPADLPAHLFCVQNCPTAASLAEYFAPESQAASPFVVTSTNNFQPTPENAVVTYSGNVASAMLRDATDSDVTFEGAEAYQEHQMFSMGVNSGRLFTQLSDAECGTGLYCDWKVNGAEVYYQWQTGPNSWNQFAAVKNSSGAFLTFDAPMQVSYNVPVGTKYGQYSGKSIVLQYSGFGELFGLPGNCVSSVTNLTVNCNEPGARYVPSFVIPNDATNGTVSDGTNTYLVKWLDREIRFAQKSLGTCTTAGLTVPANVTLPTAGDLKNPTDSSSDVFIGAQPVVTTAPRVIHGDVKY
ncbi:MAG: hypothetical protein ABI885_12505 [Gammaproteobacteria bacterium]